MKKSLLLVLLLTVVYIHSYSQNFLKRFTEISEQVSIGDILYFVAEDDNYINGLWRSDGTTKGTYLIKEFSGNYAAANPSNLYVYNNTLYFSATDAIYGNELWKSNGTTEGTEILSDIHPSGSSLPSNFVICNGIMYFLATNSDGSQKDIWRTDGTKEGTYEVKRPGYFTIGTFTSANNKLYYTNRYGSNQLWTYDTVTNFYESTTIDDYYSLAEFRNFGNELYFISHTTYRNDIRFYRLQADGTLTLLKELHHSAYGSIDIGNFTLVNNSIFFSVHTHNDYDENFDALWITDGTAEGTKEVISFDWEYYFSNSTMSNYVAYNNELYFISGSTNNRTLWKSDGTTEGTMSVTDFAIDTNSSNLEVSNNLLYFSANGSDSYGNELYYTDGSENNVNFFSEINDQKGSNPTNLFDVNGTLYFMADDGQGTALWNNIEKPEISIRLQSRKIQTKETLNIGDLVIDGRRSFNLFITNKGKKDLYLSDISVYGNEWSVNNSKNKIEPLDVDTLKLYVLPNEEGTISGKLKILNNDPNENEFEINLSGTVTGQAEMPFIFYDSTSVQKHINYAVAENKLFTLSNYSINEDDLPNTTVANFICNDGNISNWTIELNTETDNDDNKEFSIVNNELILLNELDYETKNTYVIDVVFSNQNENIVSNESYILQVNNVNEPAVIGACNKIVYNMSYALTDAEFIDENTIFAVGDNGVILHSTDYGKSWEKINSGTLYNLDKIQFVNDKTGYIMGNYNNLVLKTIDGGLHWFPLDINYNEYPYITNIFFINEDLGFITGEEGMIFKTTDGGKSWELKTLGYNNFKSIGFIDENTGFICGTSRSLYKTSDSGKTWTKVDLNDLQSGSVFKDIVFTSEQTGYILTQDGQILSTSDSGNSWEIISKVSTDYAEQLLFVDENVGYVVGGWSGATLFKTSDGGGTWSSDKTNDTGIYASLSAIAFNPSGTNGITVGNGASYGSTSEHGHVILSSQDNGDNWDVVSNLNGTMEFRDVFFEDNTGYIVANKWSGDYLLKTEDNGLTWNPIKFVTDRMGSCFFIDKNNILTVSDSIYISNDGGLNWISKEVPLYWDSFQCLSNQTLLMMQAYSIDNRVLYRSDDLGTTWQPVYTTDKYVYNSYFGNDQTGFLMGSDIFLQTKDGGKTWKEFSFTDDGYLRTGYILDENQMFLAGSNGILLKTNNGGNSWESLKTQIKSDIQEINFTSSTEGYLITTNQLYTTKDAGLTWAVLTGNMDRMLDLEIYDGNAYVVGPYGLFIKVAEGFTPSAAGYISGETDVCAGDFENYKVLQMPYSQNKWSITQGNPISYSDTQGYVEWKDAGQYTIEVQTENGCGVGLPQYLDINVNSLPQVQILGNDTAYFETEGVIYSSVNSVPERNIWYVDGAVSESIIDAESISVNWGTDANGYVELIGISEEGCRNKALKQITLEEFTVSEEDNKLKNVDVYPNPASQRIYIDFNFVTIEESKMTLLTPNGTVVMTKNITNQTEPVNVSNIPDGIYLLKIERDNESRVFKVIIKN